MIGGGLEGSGPSQPWPALDHHRFTAPTERAPSGGSPGNSHSLVATMIGGGLEGCGPSQPWSALDQHRLTAPTERAPSRIGQQWRPFLAATMEPHTGDLLGPLTATARDQAKLAEPFQIS